MKKRVFLIAIVFSCFFAVSHSLAGNDPNTPVTQEDTKQIQESAQGLRQVFGIEQPTTQQPPQTKEKTLADIADRTLDLAQRLVTNVAVTLQKIAPDVWRILIKQQYAKAIGDLLPPWALLLATILYYAILKKSWKLTDKTSSDEAGAHTLFVSLVPVLAGIVFTTWGIVALSRSIKLLINPQFYAIRDLLTMILNKGQTM